MKLVNTLRSQILSSYYKPDDKLPSVRELAAEYGLSYVTTRQAIKVLCDEGLCRGMPGKGTFVTAAADTSVRNILLFIDRSCFELAYENAYYRPITTELRQELSVADYRVRYFFVDENTEELPFSRSTFISPRIHGIVILGSSRAVVDSLVEEGRRSEIPVFNFFGKRGMSDVIEVSPDLERCGVMAVQHLLEKGYTRIGYLGRCLRESSVLQMPYHGFQREMQRQGLELRSDWVFGDRDDWWSYELGYRQAMDCLQQKDRPEAFVAQTDCVGIGAIRAGRELQLECPRDFAMIGLESSGAGEYYIPRLTMTDVRLREVGRRLAKAVTERIEHGQWHSPGLVVEPTMIEGEST